MAFSLTSNAFVHDGLISMEYTCDADAPRIPEMVISGIPDGSVSLAFIMDDPDIPQAVKDERGIEVFDHWILFDIPPETIHLTSDVGVAGKNSRDGLGYVPPCPPKEHEPTEHRYMFTLYALDTYLHLPEGATRSAIEQACTGHILAQTQLIGRYARI